MNRFTLFFLPFVFFAFAPFLDANDSGPDALRRPDYVVVVSKTTMDAPGNWEQKLEIEAAAGDPAKVRMVFTVTPAKPPETKKLSGESPPWNSPRPIVLEAR